MNTPREMRVLLENLEATMDARNWAILENLLLSIIEWIEKTENSLSSIIKWVENTKALEQVAVADGSGWVRVKQEFYERLLANQKEGHGEKV
jgi:hypothetical protein